MDRIVPGTPDGTEENVERLAELFPEVVTEVEDSDGNLEHVVDFDALRDLLGDVAEGQRERYQFTWPGKAAAKAEARKPIWKTMRPEKDRSVDWDTTKNLYIEGDNLDALKLLKETYAGQVKLIYIDPPYNTGHDFIYDDDYSQTREEYDAESADFDEDGGRLVANPDSNGRFHSDWCSMIYPRLVLARDLLASDGFIFVSIDDNELINLRKIMDEVFSPTNLIAQVITVANPGGRDYGQIAVMHEYILIYTKGEGKINLLPSDKQYPCVDTRGGYEPRELRNRNPRFTRANRPNLFYPFYANPDERDRYGYCSVSLIPDVNHNVEIYPLNAELKDSCWRWSKPKAEASMNNDPNISDVVAKRASTGKWNVYEKSRLATTKVKSIWDETSMRTEDGTRQMNALFPETVGIFNHPKSVSLIERCIQLATNSNDLVLDFFSGSGTTAEAVARRNMLDQKGRRFILVQFPEECMEESDAAKAGYHTICDIGEERIRRAGKRIASEVEEANRQLKLGEEPKKVPDIGFRVLRIDSSNMEDTYRTPGETDQMDLLSLADNVKLDRTPEDLLFEVLPKFRIPYSARIERRELGGRECFLVDGNRLIACFDTEVGTETIEEMAKLEPDYAVMRDASMKDDATQANFEELFKTYSPDTVRRVI